MRAHALQSSALKQHGILEVPTLKCIVFHLGTHKAASTSIQLYCANNRSRLREAGYCYPTPPEPTSFAHHGLAWRYIQQFSGAQDRPGNYSFSEAIAEFQSSGCHTLLLSSEDFLVCTDYPNFFEEIEQEIRAVFDKIVVTAYVRDRKSFLAASYNQWVKSLVYDKDFQTYLSRVTTGNRPPIHYTRSLGRWADFADQAIYLPFEQGNEASPLEHKLLKGLGIKQEEIDSFKANKHGRANASIGPMSVLAHRKLKHRLDETSWFDPYNLEAREPLNFALQQWTDERRWNNQRLRVFNADNVALIRDVFGDEDERFAQRFGEEQWKKLGGKSRVADDINELNYSQLATTLQHEIDEVVHMGMELAKQLYMKPGSNPPTGASTSKTTDPARKGLSRIGRFFKRIEEKLGS